VSLDTKAAGRAINLILWRDWDPISAGVPEDEYSGFVWPVFRLIVAGAGRDLVGLYLRTQAEELGCAGDETRLSAALDKLMALDIVETEMDS